jgi:hypothetical protein
MQFISNDIVSSQWWLAYSTNAFGSIFSQKACLEYFFELTAYIDIIRATVVATNVQFVNGTKNPAASIVEKKV